MNVLTKIIPAFLLLFAGTASAYDHNLLWKAEQLEKSTWALSKHLNNNRNIRYGRHLDFRNYQRVANDAKRLARAARSLKWTVRNNSSDRAIHNRFSTLKYRYNHLMSNIADGSQDHYGYRGRHLGHDIRRVQRSFNRVRSAVFNSGRHYNRYNRSSRYYSY